MSSVVAEINYIVKFSFPLYLFEEKKEEEKTLSKDKKLFKIRQNKKGKWPRNIDLAYCLFHTNI